MEREREGGREGGRERRGEGEKGEGVMAAMSESNLLWGYIPSS